MSDRVEGRVKWFNDKKGFGFIEREGSEDVFVHFREIRAGGSSRRTLHEAAKVEFSVEQGQKGMQAVDVVELES